MKETLRIALVCTTDPYSGGAASYEQSVVEKIIAAFGEEIELFLYIPKKSAINPNTGGSNLRIIEFKTRFLDYVLMSIRSTFAGFTILKALRIKYGRFESSLNRNNVDLVYFLSPNPLAIDLINLPMINTVWDIGHRDLPEFPEISGNQHFEEREFFFNRVLPRSFRVIVDTQATADKISTYYGVQSSKILKTGIYFNRKLGLETLPTNHPLSKTKYFIYPAQFWPHKNHVLLLKALQRCILHGHKVELVLTGSDKGNLSYIKQKVHEMNLTDLVHFYGFVPSEELEKLIVSAHALVFPSHLGPSNLPPLEALSVGTQSIISHVHSDPALNHPLVKVVNSFDMTEWSNALIECAQNPKPASRQIIVDELDFVSIIGNCISEFCESREQWDQTSDFN